MNSEQPQSQVAAEQGNAQPVVIETGRVSIGVPEIQQGQAMSEQAFDGFTILGGMQREGYVTLNQAASALRSELVGGRQEIDIRITHFAQELVTCKQIYETSGPDAAEEARRRIKILFAEIINQLQVIDALDSALQIAHYRLPHELSDSEMADRVSELKAAEAFTQRLSSNLRALRDALKPARDRYGYDVLK